MLDMARKLRLEREKEIKVAKQMHEQRALVSVGLLLFSFVCETDQISMVSLGHL